MSSAGGGGRTHTVEILSLLPLPLGYTGSSNKTLVVTIKLS